MMKMIQIFTILLTGKFRHPLKTNNKALFNNRITWNLTKETNNQELNNRTFQSLISKKKKKEWNKQKMNHQFQIKILIFPDRIKIKMCKAIKRVKIFSIIFNNPIKSLQNQTTNKIKTFKRDSYIIIKQVFF